MFPSATRMTWTNTTSYFRRPAPKRVDDFKGVVYNRAGISATYASNRLDPSFRDVHIVTQHVALHRNGQPGTAGPKVNPRLKCAYSKAKIRQRWLALPLM